MTDCVSRRECLVVVLGAALLSPRFAFAGSASAENAKDSKDTLLQRIAAARAGLKTLSGPFTQTRSLGLFASEIRSSGTLSFAAPDRLRWDLGPPDDVSYWVTPEGLAYKSATSGGRISNDTARGGAALGDLRALLGGDLASLRGRYELTVTDNGKDGPTFEATARDAASRLRKIRFALASDLVRPTRVTLYEGSRDKTEIVFGELVRDVLIPAARMRAP